MPFFSKVFKPKDAAGANGRSKSHSHAPPTNGHAVAPAKPRFVSSWTSKEIDPNEVQELIHACTLELKSRAEALDAPFFLLPFRPEIDTSPARIFIRNFYSANHDGSSHYTGDSLRKELVLTEPAVLCSILKWCWSRIPGGVVTWSTYEGFSLGEKDSLMARNAFTTLIPLSVDCPAREKIIFDFFDLLAAVAAHGKLNGLGGRKLSRMAGWWAFEHSDQGSGFDGGYKSWSIAADASSHLFFAYLRSLKPESLDGFTGINALPRYLQSLVAQTSYPPEPPTVMQKKTPKVVMLVDNVSPGPFALLRRAKHFEYRDEELQAFSEYDDPVQALTDECKRVLHCIATANQSNATRSVSNVNLGVEIGNKPDESWSRFQDFGFSDFSDPANDPVQKTRPSINRDGLRTAPRSRANNKGRPTTPSWADFLNSGFAEDDSIGPAVSTLLLPPQDMLPPLAGTIPRSSQGIAGEDLQPGELASITNFDLDDTFWWVWMTSLASEEPSERKAVFGRCALVETGILGGRWLVMEEQVKGATVVPEEGAYIVEKKSRFGFSRKSKTNRRRSVGPPKSPERPEAALSPISPPKAVMSPDQQARIRNAAAVLAQHSREAGHSQDTQRRAQHDDVAATRPNSVMTLGLTTEAGPAMKWARDFDRENIRKQYLGNDFAGKGSAKDLGEALSPTPEAQATPPRSVSPMPVPAPITNRDLPPVPQQKDHDTPTEASAPIIQVESTKKDTKEPIDLPTSPAPAPVSAPVPAQVPAQVPVAAAPIAAKAAFKEEVREAPPQVTQIERKPVPKTAVRLNNIHDHPAFRNKKKDIGPAEMAAKQAFGTESRAYSPEPYRKNTHRGFRNMFGMKKDKLSGSAATLEAPSETSLGRRMSMMRKKNQMAESVNSEEPAAEPIQNELHTPTSQVHSVERNLSRVDTQDQADAEHAFSRFDQGPLQDAPAFTPRESLDSAGVPASFHSTEDMKYADAPGAFPETPMEYPSPMERIEHSDGASEVSIPQDRWAQIKKNAAERVARMSEDQVSRPTQSILTERTEDEGETSGEETIEARVARIKARVAQLTGNAEPANGISH